MTINEYLKQRKLSYAKIAKKLECDVAYVYRSLNGKKNSLGTKVKPSDDFMKKLSTLYPDLVKIYLESLS